MKRYTVDCDICGKKDLTSENHSSIFVQTGWEPDCAGGASSKDGNYYDFCLKCQSVLLFQLLTYTRKDELSFKNRNTTIPFSDNKILVDIIQNLKKKKL